MDRRTKRKLSIILPIIIIFGGEIVALILINIPWKAYYSEKEVRELKEEMMYFSYTHQNPNSDLFIEPSIDSTYRAIDSIDFSKASKIDSDLIDPTSNNKLKDSKEDFFFNYLFDKQNNNGSFSDIGGLGNMISTYEVIEIIDELDKFFIDPKKKEDEIEDIIDFIDKSLEEDGWGFKLNEHAPESDIISTYCAIELARRFDEESLLENENILNFINDLWLLGGYRYSNSTPAATAQSTYYGIKAYLEMGMSYNSVQNLSIQAYFSSLYNLVDGGYAAIPGDPSDIQSTFYALGSLYTLNIVPNDEIETFDFILDCVNDDGGFGLRPENDEYFESNFMSGWAAIKSMSLLRENNATLADEDIDEYIENYYDWLYEHQCMNGLFGQTSIVANYHGVLSAYHVDSENLANIVDIENIWEYCEECYNKEDGGFGPQPDFDSTLFSTYCAINLYQIFYSYTDIEFPDFSETEEYLSDLQNKDGGFNAGDDIDYLLSLYEPLGEEVKKVVETDISLVVSTYWGISSLSILGALDSIDKKDLIHWISNAQGADGGFSVNGFFHGDTLSTYYGLQIFKVLNLEPMSKMGAIEFLKNAQTSDGGFDVIPLLSRLYDLPTSFLATYLASQALYDYDSQPENIDDLIEYYEDCLSSNTGGVGDFPEFGGDLRNTPYGIMLIDELRFDQSFNPNPWTDLILILIMIEILTIVLIGIIKTISLLNTSISKKLREMFEIGEHFNVFYLRRYEAIKCENLNIYVGRKPRRKLIVDSVSMQLKHGEILGVLGSSGAGKSTFVKSLLGLRKFTGTCQVYGMNVKRKAKKMRPIYGYCPQNLSFIYNNFTVLQNLLYFGKQYDMTDKEVINKAKRILRALEIEDKTHEKVKNLSGGQKRRVSIAISLIHSPIIVWMDEPSSGLDPIIRIKLWESLLKINEQFNTTLIVITHYPEESTFCHKVAIFARNRGMIDFGKPKDLLAQLPGKGRTVDLYFSKVQKSAVKRLESTEGIEYTLENKLGTEFSLFSDLNLNAIMEKIEKEFGTKNFKIKQSDAKMEQYFRIKALVLPTLE